MNDMVQPARPWLRIAFVTVPVIMILGSLSGYLSNSGFGNDWFDALVKPVFMPPGWAFGLVWPILYAMLGVALAMVLAEPESPRRKAGLTLFFIQLALNFAWSPIFFAAHDIGLAKYVIALMALLAALAARQFLVVRRLAGLLMVPYLMWLVFAATLNTAIDNLNPGASTSLLGL